MRSFLPSMVATLVLLGAFAAGLPSSLAQDADAQKFAVSGRVVSDQGVPVEGAVVNGYTMPAQQDAERSSVPERYAPAQAFTDADGRYTLSLAAGKGWLNVYYEKWRASDSRELLVEGNMTVDFTLKTPPPRTAVVEGRVLDAAGKPIAGAEVTLSGGCCYAYAETKPAVASDASGGSTASSPAIMPPDYYHDDYQSVMTGEDGSYRFETYAGLRQVSAWARGYAQESDQVEAKADATVSHDVVLLKVPASDAVVSGRVVDAVTGLPIAGAQVSLRNIEWGRYAWAETGADGRYRFTTVPGWSEIGVQVYPRYDDPVPLAEGASSVSIAKPMPVGGSKYFGSTSLVKLQSGENEQRTELTPKPAPTVALVGYVVDPDAKAGVEGARVSFYNQETGDWGEALTDKTGSFRILVRPGHYSANAWKDGYLGGAQTFVVEDEPTQRVDVLLPRGESRYAPCYDESDCGGGIVYMRGTAEAVATDGKAMAPPAAPAPGAPLGMTSASESASADEGARGAATFEGAGGGLPPYDPASTGIPAATEASAPVPGFGVVALLAGAAVALLARRVMKN